jgi:hypothetical protein
MVAILFQGSFVIPSILNNKDCIRRLEDWEGGQKFGLTGEIKQGIKHQLILHSTSSNLYMKGIIDVIDKAIEKKVNDVYPYPLFLCLEFFDLPFDFKNTIEEHINNKYKERACCELMIWSILALKNP